MGKNIDIAIVTALTEEGVAVEKVGEEFYDIHWDADYNQSIGFVRFGTLETGNDQQLQLALIAAACEGSQVASTISAVDNEFKPSVLAMCGVCAGNPDETALCDVIIANNVYMLESGKNVEEGHLSNLNTVPMEPKLNQLVSDFAGHVNNIKNLDVQNEVKEWRKSGSSFALHVGPVACGESIENYKRFWSKAKTSGIYKVIGYEMEGAHFGYVASQKRKPYLFFKGVMDYASGEKNDNCKVIAARAAADSLLSFLRSAQFIGYFDSLPKASAARKPYQQTVNDYNHVVDNLCTDAVLEYNNALSVGHNTERRNAILCEYDKKVSDIQYGTSGDIPKAEVAFSWMRFYGRLYLDCLMRVNRRICAQHIDGDPYEKTVEAMIDKDQSWTIGIKDVTFLHNLTCLDFKKAAGLLAEKDYREAVDSLTNE